jgi:hypothetical protein
MTASEYQQPLAYQRKEERHTRDTEVDPDRAALDLAREVDPHCTALDPTRERDARHEVE